MSNRAYLDFELQIQKAEADGYCAQVLDSPAGEGANQFKLPFSELELENLFLRIGRSRGNTRRVESPEFDAAKIFGRRLFSAVFQGPVLDCLQRSADEALRQPDTGLRVRLRLNHVPELADLPWEFLYNPTLNRFLALSVETPLVRYLDLPGRIKPLPIKGPLRVLVMISSPTDYVHLNVEEEWNKVQKAFGELEASGLVVVERLQQGTLPALQRQLTRAEYHVFHFIGHGGFDAARQDGVLVLEDAQKKGRLISGQDLGTILHDERTLRLVVLNACEGARTSRTDPFAGTAQSLVQQGIPAVIAMQFEISDQSAITFSQEFYAMLARANPVDAAMAEARKAIFAEGNALEWAIPVLYLRSHDGKIFDIASGPPAPPSLPTFQEIRPQASPNKPPVVSRASQTSAQLLAFLHVSVILGSLCFPILGIVAGAICIKLSPENKAAGRFWLWLGILITALYGSLLIVPTEWWETASKQLEAAASNSAPANVSNTVPVSPAVRITNSTASTTTETNYQDAIAFYMREIDRTPKRAEVFYLEIGTLYSKHGHYPEAVVAFQRALERNPKNFSAMYRLGLAYEEMSRYSEATNAYHRAAEVNPKNGAPYNGLGNVYDDLGRTEDALRAYRRALAIDRDLSAPNYNLARLYTRLGSNSTAIGFYQRYLELVPDDASAHCRIGAIHKNMRDYENSLSAYQRAIQLSPNDASIHNAIALVYEESGKSEEAIAALKRTIALTPKDPSPYQHLKELYEKLNRFKEAAEVLKDLQDNK